MEKYIHHEHDYDAVFKIGQPMTLQQRFVLQQRVEKALDVLYPSPDSKKEWAKELTPYLAMYAVDGIIRGSDVERFITQIYNGIEEGDRDTTMTEASGASLLQHKAKHTQ